MQANTKYSYAAWKWVATQILLSFLLGILLTQTFHFHPVIEDMFNFLEKYNRDVKQSDWCFYSTESSYNKFENFRWYIFITLDTT